MKPSIVGLLVALGIGYLLGSKSKESLGFEEAESEEQEETESEDEDGDDDAQEG